MSVFEEYCFYIGTGAGHSSRPVVPICITNPQTSKRVYAFALVDTGAEACVFPARIRAALGLRAADGIKRRIGTVTGAGQALEYTVKVDIFGLGPRGQLVNLNKIIHSKTVPVNFARNLKCFLIGVKDFLEDFVVTIDYERQVFSLAKRD